MEVIINSINSLGQLRDQHSSWGILEWVGSRGSSITRTIFRRLDERFFYNLQEPSRPKKSKGVKICSSLTADTNDVYFCWTCMPTNSRQLALLYDLWAFRSYKSYCEFTDYLEPVAFLDRGIIDHMNRPKTNLSYTDHYKTLVASTTL